LPETTGCAEQDFWPQGGLEKIARRETSGRSRYLDFALKGRQPIDRDRLSHLQCDDCYFIIQTFHVWLVFFLRLCRTKPCYLPAILNMNIEKFRIAEGSKVNLKNHPTDFTADYSDKKQAVEDLKKNVERLRELQDVLYAQDKYSLLIVFQAMDAAGKDGAIEHVMSGVNPQGCHVVSFKQPSSEELDHDYLWRCQKNLPGRGMIGIFNRSHYEEVLVVRVHPEYLKYQQLPNQTLNDKDIWTKRFKHIRDWEQHLVENGTHVIKFFLNVSRDEQKARFLSRIEEEDKNWKFSMGDVKERGHWDDYMKCYKEAIEATSTDLAPWYIIPADKKWFTRLAVSEVIVKKLESLDLHYPMLTEKHKLGLLEAKKMLESEPPA
jgi:PPK2 family polyphosphate:nucleotide phosphotransferase